MNDMGRVAPFELHKQRADEQSELCESLSCFIKVFDSIQYKEALPCLV